MKTTFRILALLFAIPAAAGTARLKIRGEPGFSQSPWISLRRCQAAADGFMARESCEPHEIQRPLNVQLELEPGYYVLTYANTLAFVNLRSNDRVEVELEELSIDLDTPQRVFWGNLGSYLVTRDLSHEVERQKLLQLFWGLPSRGYGSAETCSESTLLLRKICESWRANGGASNFAWMLATSAQGYSWLDFSQQFRPQRMLSVTPASVPYDNYVLVLPGAYTLHDRAMKLTESAEVGINKQLRKSERMQSPSEAAPVSVRERP